MKKSNRFRAAVIALPDEAPTQMGYWCPWCETTHVHGLAGKTITEAIDKTTNRGAHCLPQRSPLAGKGVDLTPVCVVRSLDHLGPPGPYLAVKNDPLQTRVRLGSILEHNQLGLALLRMTFGKGRSARCFDAQLVGGWAQVWASGGTWYVQNDYRDTLATGHGVGTLLARLFGVPVGIVGVRVLEDALGLYLSEENRLGLAGVIDKMAATKGNDASAEDPT